MSADVHIINKQVFEFECESSEYAFEIQKKMDYVMQHRILKACENVCDELADEQKDYQIPLIEIDLGKIPFFKLEEEIISRFEKAFYKKISDWKIHAAGEDSTIFSEQRSAFEAAGLFFLTGHLPWYSGKQGIGHFERLFPDLFSAPEEELKSFILQNLENYHFIERLISLAEPGYLQKIIELLDFPEDLIPEAEHEIRKGIEEILLRIRESGKTFPADNELSPLKNFVELYEADIKRSDEITDTKIKPGSISLRKMALELVLKLMSGKSISQDAFKFDKQIREMITEKLELNPEIMALISVKEKTINEKLNDFIKREREKTESRKIGFSKQSDGESIQEEALKFYISNAGLVILANYYSALFNELQLLEKGNFKNRQSNIKAVFLLHFICTGEEKAPEYILPLNKILCGLELEEPLPHSVSLTDAEKDECNELLKEVISNWGKLGTTSIEGLREAFLNRDGILSFENNGWKLQVERKGFDVLLDALPWSFRYIKLEWMKNLITTEW